MSYILTDILTDIHFTVSIQLNEIFQGMESKGSSSHHSSLKLKLSVCLTKHYAVKNWGSGAIAPRIL